MSKRERWALWIVVGLWGLGIVTFMLGVLIGDPIPDQDRPTLHTPVEAAGEVLMEVGFAAMALAVPTTLIVAAVTAVRWSRAKR